MNSKDYMEKFAKPFLIMYKREIMLKPTPETVMREGILFKDTKYYVKNGPPRELRPELLNIFRNLDLYKTKSGGFAIMPITSLLTGEEQKLKYELRLADAFYVLVYCSGLATPIKNDTRYPKLFLPSVIEGKELLDIPKE
jgi:hypothetical protein